MKKIAFQNIEEFKHYSYEARNTLLYSLLIPQIKPIEENQDKWMDCAINQCRTACSSAIFYNENYDFFGVTNDDIFPSYISSIFAKTLNEANFNFDGNNNLLSKANDFFQNTIIMHCIMSSYDTVIQLLSAESNITSYALINKIENKGYNELLNLDIITKDFKCSRSEGIETKTFSSKASGFSKKINTHCEILKQNNFVDTFYKNGILKASYSDLFYNLMDTDLRLLKNMMSLYSDSDTYTEKYKDKNWKTSKDFYEFLLPIDWRNPEELSYSNSITDKLYLVYKTENFFGLELASCITQNINQLKEYGKLYPDGINEVKIIALMSRLPNVFSRNLYLQFAFEVLWGNIEKKGTFFKNILRPESVATQEGTSTLNIHDWLMEYQKFCVFFSDFVFPIYEWYFLLILLDTVKQKGIQNPLITLQELLSDYIEKNHSQIIHEEYKNYKFLLPEGFNLDKVKKPFFKQDEEKSPDIAPILSTFKIVTGDIKSPLLRLDRNFCINPQKNALKYNYIMGQYITSIIEDNAHL